MQENEYFCTQIIKKLGTKRIFIVYKQVFRLSFVITTLGGILALTGGCTHQKTDKVVAPWGEISDSIDSNDNFDLDQIVSNGELIVLMLSGPESYYDYHGKSLGTQFMLCQKFAEKLGVSLRVEVCRDTTELVSKLAKGDADLVANPLVKEDVNLSPDSLKKVIFCGTRNDSLSTHWVVGGDKPELAKALREWYTPEMLNEVKKEEAFLLSTRSVKRHVYSPMLNRKGGIISKWDALFVTYSRPIRWDWKLMAAQCYQESTFDPNAKSWAGACGLMQIMPATASELGLPMSQIHDPESNVAAAAKFLNDLEGKFHDIPDRYERTNFVLACYNGGYHHVRDAMALTQKYGGNPKRWTDVSRYILMLSQPQYYRDPVVRYGYMRGAETVDYVQKIRLRWQSYQGVRTPHVGFSGMIPQRAKHHKKKYNI